MYAYICVACKCRLDYSFLHPSLTYHPPVPSPPPLLSHPVAPLPEYPRYCLIHDFAKADADYSDWRVITDESVGGTSQATLSWGEAEDPITGEKLRTLVFQGRLGRILVPQELAIDSETSSSKSPSASKVIGKAFQSFIDPAVAAGIKGDVTSTSTSSSASSTKSPASTKLTSGEALAADSATTATPADAASEEDKRALEEEEEEAAAAQAALTHLNNQDQQASGGSDLEDVHGFCGLVSPPMQAGMDISRWDTYNICMRTDGGPWMVTLKPYATSSRYAREGDDLYVAAVGPDGMDDYAYPRLVKVRQKSACLHAPSLTCFL